MIHSKWIKDKLNCTAALLYWTNFTEMMQPPNWIQDNIKSLHQEILHGMFFLTNDLLNQWIISNLNLRLVTFKMCIIKRESSDLNLVEYVNFKILSTPFIYINCIYYVASYINFFRANSTMIPCPPVFSFISVYIDIYGYIYIPKLE